MAAKTHDRRCLDLRSWVSRPPRLYGQHQTFWLAPPVQPLPGRVPAWQTTGVPPLRHSPERDGSGEQEQVPEPVQLPWVQEGQAAVPPQPSGRSPQSCVPFWVQTGLGVQQRP